MSNNLWETEVLSLRIIRTDSGYMLEHNGAYVCDNNGGICWATLDEVMEVFSKLVLSDALIPMRMIDIEPDCGTPMLMQSMEDLGKLAEDKGC